MIRREGDRRSWSGEFSGILTDMKITGLDCTVYRWPRPEPIANGSNTYDDATLLLLEVHTEQGVTGKGWIGGTAAGRPLEIFAHYAPFYRERVIGWDPGDSAELIRRLENEHIKTFGYAGGHCQVTGALDAALWDVRGRAAGKPVHELLSGKPGPRRVRAYIAGGYYYGEDEAGKGIERLRQELRHNVDVLRARSVKIKVGKPDVGLEVDAKRVAAARDEIGPDLELMVDANCAFKDFETARNYARAFEPHDVFWFEEPFRPDALDLHRRLAAEKILPIATGENIYTVEHFREMFRQRSVQVVNADVAILTGGYDTGMEIARLAIEAGCRLAPHGCQELQCHYVAAGDEKNGRLEIYPHTLDVKRNEIFREPLRIEDDGYVTIPNLPGIGLVPRFDGLEDLLVATG